MNKTELIQSLRNPNQLTSSNLEDLEDIIREYPYLLSARLLLAKGSKNLGDKKTKKRIASAAIYSTDRILLKKYLSSDLFFLGQAATQESYTRPQTKKKRALSPSATVEKFDRKEGSKPGPDKHLRIQKQEKKGLSTPQIPSEGLDALLDELKRDMENLKASRHHFVEVQQQIKEEDDAVVETTNESEVEAEDSPPPSPKKKIEEQEPIHFEEKPTRSKREAEFKIELDPKEEELFSKKLRELSKRKEEESTEQKEKHSSRDEDKNPEKPDVKSRFPKFSSKSYFESLEVDFERDFDFFDKTQKEKDKNIRTESYESKTTKAKEKEAFKKLTTKGRKSNKTLYSKPKLVEKKGLLRKISTKEESKKKDFKNKEEPELGKQKNIIDKFIKESPSIKYTRKKETSTIDLSETSVTWDRNIASE
ncbi:MAG: hypothetical protein OXH57_10825, partial [Ekhidna sp.]|nr:hypothetical protein [Ekhidna sp.]